MKNLIFAGILLLLVTPAFAELSDSDLQRIREVVQIEVVAEGKQISKDLKEYMEIKISAVNPQFAQMNSQFTQVNNRIDELSERINIAFMVLGWLFALVIAAIGIPQLITAFKQRGHERLQTSVEELRVAYDEVLAELRQLREENEMLKQRDKTQPESS